MSIRTPGLGWDPPLVPSPDTRIQAHLSLLCPFRPPPRSVGSCVGTLCSSPPSAAPSPPPSVPLSVFPWLCPHLRSPVSEPFFPCPCPVWPPGPLGPHLGFARAALEPVAVMLVDEDQEGDQSQDQQRPQHPAQGRHLHGGEALVRGVAATRPAVARRAAASRPWRPCRQHRHPLTAGARAPPAPSRARLCTPRAQARPGLPGNGHY